VPLDAAYVPVIELALQEQLPGRWRRLNVAELAWQPLHSFCAGWRIDVPAALVRIHGVDHLVVVVDAAFPNSQPRVFAPQAGSDFRWPHVEADGLLCLKSTRLVAAPGERVLQHLLWAEELLNYSEVACRREFEREFVAYWNQRSSDKKKRPDVLSLSRPRGESREVFYYTDRINGRIVFADSKSELVNWLRNSGSNPADREMLPTWLLRLCRPWAPKEYPELGRDLLSQLPEAILRRVLNPGRACPLVFEARTPTGPAFAAVLLHGAAERELVKGFRGIAKVPISRILASFSGRAVQRCPVARVDGPWVHGRGHDEDYPAIRSKSVALVGCGAIGGSLAKLLAQTGVGKFLLIDPDDLTPANVARHVLGMRYIGENKARATAQMLRRDFPHIEAVMPYTRRFQQLTARELEAVSNADLIISAGIDFDGDAMLNAWRRQLATPPAHLCTWTEAYAIVGHAVLIYGADSLMAGFDETEQPLFRLTDWTENSAAMVLEAGCGNLFQPHGMVALQPTVVLAARLAIDVLLERVPKSCRRVWQGDLDSVVANGGSARLDFSASYVVKESAWY
jgi:hypothetical protein